jgi:hypothetical protein
MSLQRNSSNDQILGQYFRTTCLILRMRACFLKFGNSARVALAVHFFCRIIFSAYYGQFYNKYFFFTLNLICIYI